MLPTLVHPISPSSSVTQAKYPSTMDGSFSSQQISSQPKLHTLQNTLLRLFQGIVELAPTENKDRQMTATQTYQIQVHAASIIQNAEELLSITRALKEAWLFGRLGAEPVQKDSGGAEVNEGKTEEDAVFVAEYLRGKIRELDEGETHPDDEKGR